MLLFFVNKTRPNTFDLIKLLGGDEDKDVLLVGDGVFYANPLMVKKFKDLGVDTVYAAKDAVEERVLEVAGDCEVVDYDEMVDLVMEDHDKVITV